MFLLFTAIFTTEISFFKNSTEYFLDLNKGIFNFSLFPSRLSLIKTSNRYILKSGKYFLCKIDNSYLPCSRFTRAAKLRILGEGDNFFILNEEKNCLAPEYKMDPVRQTYAASFVNCSSEYAPELIIKYFT